MLGKIIEALADKKPHSAKQIARKCHTDASSVLKAIHTEPEGWWIVEQIASAKGFLFRLREIKGGYIPSAAKGR